MKKMCKKVVSLLLAAVMVLTMTAFASVVYAADEDSVEADPNFKMGVILVGDETEGYSAAHIAGVKEAAKELGLDDSQIIWKYKVPEDSSCYDAAIDLVGQGCSLVIGNSYGHQTYLVQAAQEYPDVTFVSMTGDFVEKLLLQFPDLSIYMENMFDDDPDMLRMLSERLIKYPNYGVCLDYAHASLSRTKIDIWVEALAPYVRHVHINDHDGKHDLHLAVGSGVTDWKKFAVFYEKYFSRLTVLVETTRPDWQKQSLDYLMRLGVK